MVVGCLAKRRRAQERRAAVSTPTLGRDRPVVLITGADLAPEALALLHDYQLAYAGKTPTEQSIIELCRELDPVAIIVRYGKIGAAALDAAPSLRVLSTHKTAERRVGNRCV